MSATTTAFGQLPALHLRAPDGAEATITLYGAHLVSWSPPHRRRTGQERLFVSSLSSLDGKRAIRGGVPVIFPQFAERGHGHAPRLRARLHLARARQGEQDGAAYAVLALDARPTWRRGARSGLAAPFELRLRVALHGAELAMALTVRNTGSQPFPFAAALHTYHLVEDVEAVRIDGVQRETLAITDKLDQVFERIAGDIAFDTGADKLRLQQSGFTDAVVWNPGAADAAALSDLDDEEYRRFVCIEPALLRPTRWSRAGAGRGISGDGG